jgi:ABC-2 type transport system ATP-binding protein
VSEWLERVDLADVEKKRCEELSKGMQQKVQFIAAVLHDPELLILDEPFSGLDPVNMRLLRDLFTEQHEKGKTIIFSTHVMHQAEQLCKHIVMIHEGRKVLDQPLSEIRARFDPRTIFFEPLDAEVDAARLEAVPGVARASSLSGTFELAVDESAEPREVIQRVIAQASPARVELHRPSLEDVFVEIVKGSSSREEIDAVRAALREDDAASSEHAEVGP